MEERVGPPEHRARGQSGSRRPGPARRRVSPGGRRAITPSGAPPASGAPRLRTEIDSKLIAVEADAAVVLPHLDLPYGSAFGRVVMPPRKPPAPRLGGRLKERHSSACRAGSLHGICRWSSDLARPSTIRHWRERRCPQCPRSTDNRALVRKSVTRDQVGQLLEGEPLAGLAREVPRPYRGENCLGLQGGQVLFALPGSTRTAAAADG